MLQVAPHPWALSHFRAFVYATPSAWSASSLPFIRQITAHPFQWCAGKCLTAGSPGQKMPWFGAFADFCSVNTPTRSNFSYQYSRWMGVAGRHTRLLSQLQLTTDLGSPPPGSPAPASLWAFTAAGHAPCLALATMFGNFLFMCLSLATRGCILEGRDPGYFAYFCLLLVVVHNNHLLN